MLFRILHCSHPHNISVPSKFNIIISRMNVIFFLAFSSCREIMCTSASNVRSSVNITCVLYRYVQLEASWKYTTSTRRKRWWVPQWFLDPVTLRKLSSPLIKGYQKMLYLFFVQNQKKAQVHQWRRWGGLWVRAKIRQSKKHLLSPLIKGNVQEVGETHLDFPLDKIISNKMNLLT